MAPHNPISSFLDGLALPLRAAGFLLARPRLWLLVLAPLVMNCLLFAGLLYWGFTTLAEMLRTWTGASAGWHWAALALLAKALFWIVVLAVVYFLFTPMALLIAAPFNDYLAESTERACGIGLADRGRPLWKALASEAAHALVAEAVRIAFCGSVFVFLLVLNLIPVWGSMLYLVLGFYWAMRCAAFEFISYAADRRRIPFREKWGLLRRHAPSSYGFGAATVFLLSIPFVNALAVPVCAVAGTFLFAKMQRESVQS
ncbi:MAG: EI24 domain-containing protein [Candidatus Sumerlaeota bacterium]|nr:EI24 domain-containing protein [Candidatus Sumerlaeota bacterium]